jgi:hypothetical protein
MSLIVCLLATSAFKHPQDLVLPLRKLYARGCVIFPHSQRHKNRGLPDGLGSAGPITVNLPKIIPATIGE